MVAEMKTKKMIRPTLVTLTLACLTLWAAAALAGAPMESVVVYRDRAQVTRSQKVDCAGGEAHFTGLPSTMDAKTLWGSLSGGPGTVVGLTHTEEATGPRPEAKSLQKKIRALDVQMVDLSRQRSAAAASARKLSSFRSHMIRVWGHQATGKKAPTRGWDQALDLLRARALAASSRQRAANVKRRALQRQRNELSTKLALIRRKQRRTTYKVTAMLRCTGRRTVQLSYVVPGATWRVSYQFRAHPRRRKVTLVAQAVVKQGTGEDWKNVELSVSTANLQRKNIPPSIQPMRISTNKPRDTRKVLTRRFEHRRKLTAKAPSGAAAQPGPAARTQRQGLAMRLRAARKVTIPSDGRRVVVELTRRTVSGDYSLETVPKLYPYVYRKVSINNPYAFTMLPGPVEIYKGNAFVGRAQLKQRATGEPFAFSLGVDNQLQVRRYVKVEKMEKAGALSSEKKLRHRYVLQLGNWTRRTQTLRVLENLPVSQVRKIKVSLSKDSTRPSAWNKTDGMLTWVLKLSPRSKKKVVLDYTIAVPKDYVVHGY